MEKEQLINKLKTLSDSVRKKKKALTVDINKKVEFLQNTFNPVIDTSNEDKLNLKEKSSTINTTEENVEQNENNGMIPIKTPLNIPAKGLLTRKYLSKLEYDGYKVKKRKNSHVFGARIENNALKIGSSELIFDDSDNIIINNKVFKGTPGLFELVFNTNPKQFSKKDLSNFKNICMETNVHRINYSQNKPIYRNTSKKYKHIILRLFPPRKKKSVSEINLKTANQSDVLYYNDINDLVDRMRLLHDVKNAGHTGVDNEMIALVNELKRRNVIV